MSASSQRVRHLEMKKAGTKFLTSYDGHDSEPSQELEAPMIDDISVFSSVPEARQRSSASRGTRVTGLRVFTRTSSEQLYCARDGMEDAAAR